MDGNRAEHPAAETNLFETHRHHPSAQLLSREEFFGGFRQIRVIIAQAGDQTTQRGDDEVEVGPNERREQVGLGTGGIQDYNPLTFFEHAQLLAERPGNVGDIAHQEA